MVHPLRTRMPVWNWDPWHQRDRAADFGLRPMGCPIGPGRINPGGTILVQTMGRALASLDSTPRAPGRQAPERAGLPASTIEALQRGVGNAAVARMLARAPSAEDDAITDAQVDAAIAWAGRQNMGEEAIRELQTAIGAEPTGVYDRGTAAAVHAKQREWQPRGKISGPGLGGPQTFARLGLIVTQPISAATVGDDEIAQIRETNSGGVTVALYADYGSAHSGAEFVSQASIFAKNQGAVGVKGGAVALGIPTPIGDVSDVIEICQSIHRGLLAKEQAGGGAEADAAQGPAASGGSGPDPWAGTPPGAEAVPEASAGAGGGGTAGGAGGASALPAHTRIRNLALFAHGESWGMGLDKGNKFQLSSKARGLNPPNLAAFARGIKDACTPDVGVQLFACLTGKDAGRSDYEEWTGHAQGEKKGEGSFAAGLAEAMGPEASVYGHTTAGHTTENFAARVFGAAAGGGGEGGLHMFDVLYPEEFVQSELARCFTDKTEEELADLHDPLREQMWEHYKDSLGGEHRRAKKDKRYPVPIGQEMMANPAHASELVQADFPTWVASRLSKVKPAKKKKAAAAR